MNNDEIRVRVIIGPIWEEGAGGDAVARERRVAPEPCASEIG